MLILPICEHRISFLLFESFLVSFFKIYFSVYGFFTSLIKFIARYFIIFDVILNDRVVFLFQTVIF